MFHCDYVAPDSLDELLSVLHQHGGDAKVIAGGTDVIPQMRAGKLTPRILVDPRRLSLSKIAQIDHGIQIGASITHTQVIGSAQLKNDFPALVDACQQVGGPPVRNRGTLAGNLANASPAADSALPLLAYDAQVVISHLDGQREIPLDRFFIGPGQSVLSTGEFIQSIYIPKTRPLTSAVFLKLGNRLAMAIAVASIAIRLSFSEAGQITEARLALGSVAPAPFRAYQAEALLLSNPLDGLLIEHAAQAARAAADPISDLRASAEYRSQMVEVLTRRAIRLAIHNFSPETEHA
jgi:CO/xanthine dehydrogenase FAD-binding subunit